MRVPRPLFILFFAAIGAPGCGGEIGGSDAPPVSVGIDNIDVDLNWVTRFTSDAVIGGDDLGHQPLYICLGHDGNSWQPGKMQASWNQCHYSYGGAERWTSDYKVLTTRWADAANGAIPAGAVPSSTDAAFHVVYYCRAAYGRGVHPGKIEAGWAGCLIPYGNREVNVPSYQVLTGGVRLMTQHVPAGAALPKATLAAGRDDDGTTLFPCLGVMSDGTWPGKTRRDWKQCHVSWGNTEQFLSSYDVLVPTFLPAPLPWVDVQIPVGVDTSGAPLGLCTVAKSVDGYGYPIPGGSQQIGKVLSSGACAYAFGNKELVATADFSVFYVPDDCGYEKHKCCRGNNCIGSTTCDQSTNQCVAGGLGQPCRDLGGGNKGCDYPLTCNTSTNRCQNGGSGGSGGGGGGGSGGGGGGGGSNCGLEEQQCCATAWPCHVDNSVCLPTGRCSSNCGTAGHSCCKVYDQPWCATGADHCDEGTGSCLP